MISYRDFQKGELGKKCDLDKSDDLRFVVPPEELHDSFILANGSVYYQVFKSSLSDATQKKLREMNESGVLNGNGEIDPDIFLRIKRGRNDEAEIFLLRQNRQTPPASVLEKFMRIGENGKEKTVAEEDMQKLNKAAREEYQKRIAPRRAEEVQELKDIAREYRSSVPLDLEHADSQKDLLAKYAKENGVSGLCSLSKNKSGGYSLQEKVESIEIDPELTDVYAAAETHFLSQKSAWIDSTDDRPDALTLLNHAEGNGMSGGCVLFKNDNETYSLRQKDARSVEIKPENAEICAAAEVHFSSASLLQRTSSLVNLPMSGDVLPEKIRLKNETPLPASDLPEATELLKMLPFVRAMELSYNETLRTDIDVRIKEVSPEGREKIKTSSDPEATVFPPEKSLDIKSTSEALMKKVASNLFQYPPDRGVRRASASGALVSRSASGSLDRSRSR